MKRWIAIIFCVLLLFSGCTEEMDVSREEIIAVYEAAGYKVSSRVYDTPQEFGLIGYIQAEHPDGDYIYFSIFETPEQAEDYQDTYYQPGVTGFFSVIFGEPSWQRWEVHGCMVVQFDEPEYYELFLELVNSK